MDKSRLSEFVAKYLDNECLHPINIRNRYTNKELYVPCGHCMVCYLKKANTQTALASSMASHFKYVHFVTLKYSDEFIPKLHVKSSEWTGENVNVVFESTRKLPDNEKRTPKSFTFSKYYTEKQWFDHFNKVSGRYSFAHKSVVYPGRVEKFQDWVPYVDKEDFFCFMKRLRINIARKIPGYGKQVLYYAVSEYGPQTYRPHWHLLLFTNSSLVSETLPLLIRSCWTYGNYDISLSRGFAASYVASYVNSFACLPGFYTDYQELRPRSFHSKGYSTNQVIHIPNGINDLERCSDEAFNGVSTPIDGKYVKVRYSNSLKNLLFPRFSDDLFPARHHVVSLVQSAIGAPSWLVRNGYLPIDQPDLLDDSFNSKAFARGLADYITNNYPITERLGNLNRGDNLINWLLTALYIDPNDSTPIYYDKLVESIRRLFSKIRRWLIAWNLRDPFSPTFRFSLYKLVDASFNLRDRERYRCLSDYFEYLEQISLQDDSTPVFEYLKAYTLGAESRSPEVVANFKKTLRNRAFVRFYDRIKHKKYNDLTGVLLA